MATNTYIALDKVSVSGTSTTSITFSSISNAYTDLVIVIGNGGASGDVQPGLRFNGDSGSNYSFTNLSGNGSTTSSSSAKNDTDIQLGYYDYLANGTNNYTGIVNIMNYSNSTTYKTVIQRGSNAATGTGVNVGLWRNTAAITSITILPSYGSSYFLAGTTFSLYGIRAEGVSPAPKATGGAIYSDADYYYHAFGASGTFTPLQSLTADILVVAGGGSGGQSYGGGGGAGGLLGFTSQSLSATGYTCTVGAGGAAADYGSTGEIRGNNGSNSQFGGLTAAIGGGGGGGDYGNVAYAGRSGGSGGGGSSAGGGGGPAGTGTSGQGYAGSAGIGTYGVNSSGGGGGGAGGAAVSTGLGGVGSSAYSAWVIATGVGQVVAGTGYIAGGGGGQHYYPNSYNYGGYGGGGQGSGGYSSGSPNAARGLTNTGSGGGGQGGGYGAGGSGVVIVRYAKV